MALYYSKIENGFFNSDIHNDIPRDSVRVTEEERRFLLSEVMNGKIIDIVNGKAISKEVVPTKEELLEKIRMMRNRLLDETDYTQVPDYPMSDEKRQEWADYRQALRDLPEKYEDNPSDVVWPTKPE